MPPRAVLLVALSGLAVTAALCVFQVSSNNADAEAAFRKIAQERLAATQQRYDSNLANQEGVNALFRASDNVTLSEFRRFVGQPRATPWRYRTIEWAVRVDGTERTAFETDAAAPIRDRRADGAYVAATERPEYFPVTHVWPQTGNETQRGFDLANDAVRWNTLQRAIDTARPVVAAPVPLPTAGGDRSAYLAIIPSYVGDKVPTNVRERREQLKGVTVGVYRFGDNLADMLAQSRSAVGQHILIYASYAYGALPAYVHVSRRSTNAPPLDTLGSLALGEARTMPGAYVGQVRLANLSLPLVFLSAHEIGGIAGFRWLTLGVMLAGLAGTLSLSLLVWRRERLVANARRAETVHRAILATSNDAFIQFDRHGKIAD